MEEFSPEEKKLLLKLARQSIEDAVRGRARQKLDLTTLPEKLTRHGATFVTLTKYGQLRGCIGTLEAYQPLGIDVQEHAIDAALRDYRFSNVMPDELEQIEIEISCLTPPQPLDYDDAHDLLIRLRPGVDGVILRDGNRKATFLPQVWEKLPDPAQFLNHLCEKMGVTSDLWRHKHLTVAIYQVVEFHE